MSCLDINIDIKNSFINPLFDLSKSIDVTIDKFVDSIHPVVQELSKHINIQILLVCTVGKQGYLHVEPTTMWVTPDMIKELLIKSNVEWVIN